MYPLVGTLLSVPPFIVKIKDISMVKYNSMFRQDFTIRWKHGFLLSEK